MNGTSFNRRMFAGAATGAALAISASINFAAAATVTEAVPNIVKSVKAQWASPTAAFGGTADKTDALNGNWSGNATFSASSVTSYGAKADWSVNSFLRQAPLGELVGELEFQSSSDLVAIPGDKFGFISPVSTTDFALDGKIVKQTVAGWVTNSSWANTIPSLINRGAIFEDISSPAALRLEADQYVATDNTVYRDAYSFLTASLSWAEDPTKATLFVGDAVWREEIQIEIVPQLGQALSMAIEGSAALEIDEPLKTSFSEANWAQSGSNFTAVGALTQLAPQSDWGTLSILNSAALLRHKGVVAFGLFDVELAATGLTTRRTTADFGMFVNWQLVPTLTHRPQENWFGNQNQWFVDDTKIERNYLYQGTGVWSSEAELVIDDEYINIWHLWQGEGDWAQTTQFESNPTRTLGVIPTEWQIRGFRFFFPRVIKTFIDGQFVYAPERRQLTVPADDRGLVVPRDDRRFDVTGRSNTFTV
jgi:hypothetical protein